MKSVRVLFVVGLLTGVGMVSAASAAQPTVTSARSIGGLLAILHDPAASTADAFGISVAVSGTFGQ